MTTSEPSPPTLSLTRLFLKFLRFGCLAFGGPVAQIAMVRHALVEEERWISPARFNRLLAVMQILPGPEAHELCVHLGMVARGRIGGLLAGLGFMLPGFFLMLLAAWLYEGWIVGLPGAASIFFGIQVVVLAIILRAVHRIGSHILEDLLLWIIAAASFAATLAGVSFWIPLLAGGLVYAISERRTIAVLIALAAVALGFVIPAANPFQPVTSGGAGGTVTALALFAAGLKGGMLTFGGAYTAIPYVRADTVGRGWLSDGSFLDGVALAGVLPAPLVIFATFAGYVAGGWAGAIAITAGMFLPAFAFSMIFFERLEAVIENPALHGLLAGVAAAVVGVIAATLVQLGWSTVARASSILLPVLLFVAALILVWRLKGKFVLPALVIAGGIAGWLLGL
ncbi:chromate efflux transporter [Sphingopyxis sp. H115]|uniref:chromate efflux transporter n=1 Tax=Sphingopyxis sp. H115 TaxID=1759073 RepID=UPI00073635EB|nr:chromate efflux transporter [Sphingopyxis sp. H115]KTE16991.1 chromate transporter [Sphingopyxis sp. H115]